MAFVSRAERKLATIESTTPSTLGPGSYTADLRAFKPKHSIAPFSSTQTRELRTEAFVTPGPGAYTHDITKSPLFERRRSFGTTCFSSKVNRFGLDSYLTQKSDVPGPGSYNPKKNGFTYERPIRNKEYQQTSAPVVWVKVATAPSIPAPSQSYGYEEGKHGELIRQRPPSEGFSGTPDNSVGPGYYSPNDSFTRKVPKSAIFSRSRSRRMMSVDTSDLPGPGDYNAQVDTWSLKAAKKPKHSHAFISHSTSASNAALIKSEDKQITTPGPGHYFNQTSFSKPSNNSAKIHHFGSRVERDPDPLESFHAPTSMKTPGPGAYDTDLKHQIIHMPPKNSAFRSTAARFDQTEKQITSTMPGPGAYEKEGVDDMVTELIKKARIGGIGAFGSTTNRFEEQQTTLPGPGAYNPKTIQEIPVVRQRDHRSAVFVSKTDRTEVVKKKVPPVGAYEIKRAFDDNPSRPSFATERPFINKTPRFKYRDEMTSYEPTPGPGSYLGPETKTSPERRKSRDAFLSTLPRWKPEKQDSSVPGPGAYCDNDPHFIKKTFNVTINGANV